MVLAVFLVTYQICKRNGPQVEGPVNIYRKSERQALVVAGNESDVANVLAANVKVESGEAAEVTQQRRLAPTVKDLFVQESDL